MRTPLLILPVLLVAGLLAGCNAEVSVGEKEVSSEEVENDIRGQYEAKTDIDLPRLTCESTTAEVGETIECDGRNARDVELTITGEVTTVEDGRVGYRWTVAKAVAPGALFADEVGRLLVKQYGPVVADVTCPDGIEVKQGVEVTCRATAKNGDTGNAVIRLTDGDGAFTIVSFDGGTSGSSGASGA